ncbi:DUF4153 domain-containing protein [Sphingobacterium sp. lm-10]|uniref:DUF4153 domain-containing protein n=1 Tax=Sphingobacterium sp. lm-10 TaxID=2944904 RepID=UPI00202184A9|nr:DUF4153 domain-containing protein [Sphingobacterium sp. lm-10]MCL7989060.1 DUF4153 domain-containing protein [Sphingobacterium sp. lm-10]
MKVSLRNKLPSIHSIFAELMLSIKRFPAECIYALTGSFAALQLVRDEVLNSGSEIWWIRLLMLAAIAFPLNLSISLVLAKKETYSWKPFWAVKLCVALSSLLFFFLLNPEVYPQDVVHFSLLFIASILLVSFAAYFKDGDTMAWWHFNKVLILRLLTGALYSVVLGAGLSAAFATVNELLIEMDWVYLRYIWVLIFTVFFPLYFLAGVPKRLDGSLLTRDYPKGLKYFSQYVLIPLAFVYLVILLIYELKILTQWQLPNGLVSALILGYASIGILSLLLTFPIRDNQENAWIRSYSKYFYVFLIPLFILLMLAILKRVDTYGITYQRYFLIAIAAWLLFQIIYFLAFQRTTIKAIPISLFAVVLLINYGPQSALSVSLASQKSILMNLFEKEGLVKNGFLQPVAEDSIDAATAIRMASSLNYILYNYHPEVLQSILTIDIEQQLDTIKKDGNLTANSTNNYRSARTQITNRIQQHLHLTEFSNRWQFNAQYAEELKLNYYFKSTSSAIDVVGYNYAVELQPYVDSTGVDTLPNITYYQTRTGAYQEITLHLGEKDFRFAISDFIKQCLESEQYLKKYEDKVSSRSLEKRLVIPLSALRLTQQADGMEVTLQIQEIFFEYSASKDVKINSMKGTYLIKL